MTNCSMLTEATMLLVERAAAMHGKRRSSCFVYNNTTDVDCCLMSRLRAGTCLRPRHPLLEPTAVSVGGFAGRKHLPALAFPCSPSAQCYSNGTTQKDSMQVVGIDLTWSHCGGGKVYWLQTSSCQEPGHSAPTPALQSSASQASGSGCSSEQSQSPQA